MDSDELKAFQKIGIELERIANFLERQEGEHEFFGRDWEYILNQMIEEMNNRT